MQVIALIGDLVRSRRVSNRRGLQARLSRALGDVSRDNRSLASPYTLTLGDEFQAVYRRADRVVADILDLLEAIHPVQARFALGVGRLSTPVNPEQALGMDGPAFHRARAAMEALKRERGLLKVDAEPVERWTPINHVLAYVGHHAATWDRNRWRILRQRLAGVPVVKMVDLVGISKVAIHKNIRVAALDDVAAICHDLTGALARALKDA